MTRHLHRLACLLGGALIALALAPGAWGLSDSAEIGRLTNRYDSLNALSGSQDTTENVVTDTRVGVLTNVNRALDGVTVKFVAEAVGDITKDGSGRSWVNLLGSDGSCIGATMENELASRVVNLGSYKATGTTVQVYAIYHVACKEHQGELDVHVIDMQVLDVGGPVEHAINSNDVVVGVVLCGLGLALLMGFFIARNMLERRDRAASAQGRVLTVPKVETTRRSRWRW